MKIESIQTLIKVGTSIGVTIPAKDLKRAGLTVGQEVKITVEPIKQVGDHQLQVVEMTQKLIARHNAALDSLSRK